MAAKAPATETTKARTTQHRVLQNLRHNGKHINPGKTVQLTAKDAKILIDRKVVEPIRGGAGAAESETTADESTGETITE
jgi:hypothetical protein